MGRKKTKRVKPEESRVKVIREVKSEADEKEKVDEKLNEKTVRPGLGPVEFVETKVAEVRTGSNASVDSVAESPRVEESSSGVKMRYTPNARYRPVVVGSEGVEDERTAERVYRQTMRQVDAQFREIRMRQQLDPNATAQVPVQDMSERDRLQMTNAQRMQGLTGSRMAGDVMESKENLERQYDIRSTVYRERKQEQRERS